MQISALTDLSWFSFSDCKGTLDWKLQSRWAHAGSSVTCCQVCQTNKQQITIPRQWLSKWLTPLSSEACFCNRWQHIKHQGGGGDKKGEKGSDGGREDRERGQRLEQRHKVGDKKRENGPEKLRGEGWERMKWDWERARKRIKSNSEGENPGEEHSTSRWRKKVWLTAGTDRNCGNSLGIVMERNEITNIQQVPEHMRIHTHTMDLQHQMFPQK